MSEQKTEEQLKAEQEAEKQKLMSDYRQGLYQTTASGLPDPLILLLIVTERYPTLKQEYGIEKEDALEIRNSMGINKVFKEKSILPKNANALINMIYAYNTGNMLLRTGFACRCSICKKCLKANRIF